MSPLSHQRYSTDQMLTRAREFFELAATRRTVRDFSTADVPQEIKHQIRLGAEAEEREFYNRRAPNEWLEALSQLGTDANKPFLESAPYLIVIFAKKHGLDQLGQKIKNYYVPESVGIATGVLIQALHHAGLVTLTHTPSPMKFLNRILDRPNHEKPSMILVVGHPAMNAKVPDIVKKPLTDIASFH